MWVGAGALALVLVLPGVGVVSVQSSLAGPRTGLVVVLSGEDNRLNAYNAATGDKVTVIEARADDPAGLDINAEICIVPEGTPWKPADEIWFIAGEDTEQNVLPSVIKQGWGIFRLTGTSLATLEAVQLAKLVPDSFQPSDSNPENYGCGVLPDGRIVTGDVGGQLPQEPATGQLIEWFPNADTFAGSIGPDVNDFPRVPHCKIDVEIGTAGGIEVDGTDVYIASNRPALPPTTPSLGGIYAYDSSIWPTGETAADGCGRTDATNQQLADADQVGKALFIPQTPVLLTTPSDIVDSGRGTFYISNVFTGTIVEYSKNGIFVGPVLISAGQIGGITPFGIDVAPDGTLWIADIGVVGPGPAPAAGSIVRLSASAQPAVMGETIDEGLEFPDGIGVVTLAAPPVTPAQVTTTTGATTATATATTANASGDGTLARTGPSGAAPPPVLAAVALTGALVVRSASTSAARGSGPSRGRS